MIDQQEEMKLLIDEETGDWLVYRDGILSSRIKKSLFNGDFEMMKIILKQVLTR